MKSIKTIMRVLTITAMVGTAFVASSEAATISLNPQNQNALVGNAVLVDIMVNLLAGEEVGGVSLFLGFNPAILSGVGYVADPDNNMGVAACGFCDFSSFPAGGPLDLFFLADIGTALQGAGLFRLATVSFLAVGPGVTPLTFSFAQPGGGYLSDAGGNFLLNTQAINGSVCVGPNCFGPPQVPEPGTLTLLGLGLVVAGYRHRRHLRG